MIKEEGEVEVEVEKKLTHISRDQSIIFDHKEGEGGLANDHRIMVMENIIRIYTLGCGQHTMELV